MKEIDINKIDSERSRLNIQMHTKELLKIIEAINPPINFLIFGLGNDSTFWFNTNKDGRTVFIENNKSWFKNVKSKFPEIEAYLADYKTERWEWKNLINHPENLDLDLPKDILKVSWDVILVDGPGGYSDKTPGRMQSIYMASKLIKIGGDVFVHDTNRKVEKEYCDKFLLEKNVVEKVRGRALLCHYKVS